jgi:hypothetical protein
MSVRGYKMKFDFTEIRELIKIKYGTIENFAKNAGMSSKRVYNILNNKGRMYKEDILLWAELLDIRTNFYLNYCFFTGTFE